MKRAYNVVIEQDSEGFYVASVPSLPGCHTQAKSLDTLMDRVREAIELCLEVQQIDGDELDFIGVQRVSVEDEQTASARWPDRFGRVAEQQDASPSAVHV